MRQTRGGILQGLVIGVLIQCAAVSAQAQVTHIDFQVINLPRLQLYPEANCVAIRTPGEWAALWPDNAAPIPKIDFKHFILLIASTGVKPSSGYSSIFLSVDSLSASMAGPTASKKDVTTIHILELRPGNCPVLTALMSSVSYALIPQTTNEIRFVVSKADSNCASP
jgi:hypothetical protein